MRDRVEELSGRLIATRYWGRDMKRISATISNISEMTDKSNVYKDWFLMAEILILADEILREI